MLEYNSIKELIDNAVLSGNKISKTVIESQSNELGKTSDEIFNEMYTNFKVMKDAVATGLKPSVKSMTGITGGDAYKLHIASKDGKTLGGNFFDSILIKALAISEVNACMGRIVAAPTAGSCGIIPAVLLSAIEYKDISESEAVESLFTAAGIGIVIAKQACISGAEGGCQAECGSASAMAAAALVEISGGTPQMVSNACAIALKNILGLVCDPVAGLVEVPCIKRNASCAINALVAADMALAGIESVIPADEVIGAMKSIGDLMSVTLKETAEGGLATTPTGKKISKEILGR